MTTLRKIADALIQKTHRASCHCGGGVPDNCSLCRCKGAIMGAVAPRGCASLRGPQLLSVYRFSTMTVEHYFCSRCGIHTHRRRRSNPTQYGFNLGCLEGVDPHLAPGVPVNDGVNHPAALKPHLIHDDPGAGRLTQRSNQVS